MATKLILKQVEEYLAQDACKEAKDLLHSVKPDDLETYTKARWLYLLSSVEYRQCFCGRQTSSSAPL